MLETDVRMTKDGVILVCHDDNFHRLCGASSTAGDNLVRDTHSSELPLFKDELYMHFSKGQTYKLKDGDTRRFSTLEEVFTALPKDVVI